MSYTALYRKLRPKTFNDVVGQEFIIKTLINQNVSNRISHAYLFCGTRGTGKTSVAKVFAKALNCINNVNGEPCNSCEICLSILANRSLNVIEIDAASNNGVENIRDIREEVKYPPTIGKYKIYIIDEVHMLSTGAFNALLKTLEEPPEHVIFILATTDPQKIPATILSRCQRFDFRRISSNDMFEALKKYSIEENISIEDSALKYIVKASDGAMRDALSILDMSVSFYFGSVITYENILDLVGSVDSRILDDIANAINEYDSSKVVEIINEIMERGRDISQLINDLLVHFRDMLVSLSIRNTSTTLDYSEETIVLLSNQAEVIGKEKLLLYINTFSELQNKIKYISNQRVFLEITCIKLCTFAVQDDDNTLSLRLQKIESILEKGLLNNTIQEPLQISSVGIKEKPKERVLIQKAIPEDVNKLRSDWSLFVDGFKPIIKTILKLSELGYINDNKDDGLVIIVTKDVSSSRLLLSHDNFINIQNNLMKMFGKKFDLQIIDKQQYIIQHTKVYGNEDDDLTAYRNFTDKVNFPIIEE